MTPEKLQLIKEKCRECEDVLRQAFAALGRPEFAELKRRHEELLGEVRRLEQDIPEEESGPHALV